MHPYPLPTIESRTSVGQPRSPEYPSSPAAITTLSLSPCSPVRAARPCSAGPPPALVTWRRWPVQKSGEKCGDASPLPPGHKSLQWLRPRRQQRAVSLSSSPAGRHHSQHARSPTASRPQHHPPHTFTRPPPKKYTPVGHHHSQHARSPAASRPQHHPGWPLLQPPGRELLQ